MKIQINKATVENYNDIKSLFDRNQQACPEWDEISEYGLVALDNDKLIGYIWACIGDSKAAYISHLVVDRDHRVKDDTMGRSLVALSLGARMFEDLSKLGITRAVATIQDNQIGDILAETYKKIGFSLIQCKYIARGNPSVISDNLKRFRI